MTKALIVNNLKKKYKEVEALKGISFEVGEGEIFGLVGPNGAGKSTALKIIATILSPTSGSVTVFDYDIKKDAAKIREIISYLPEEAGAYKNLSGIAYLKFMAAIFTDDTEKQKEYLEFAIKIADLRSRLKDKAKTYSKGMTRKLLIARTVMSKPKLIILDEPTSGLDVINAYEIRNIIRDLAKQGMSVLLSSHNMLEIEFLSQRIGIIHEGKIHVTGTPAELKKEYQANNLEEVFVKLNS